MIKTKNGMTKIDGTLPDLLLDFVGTVEALLKNTPFTAEELHAAINVAEIVVKLGESDDEVTLDNSEVDEEPEAEKESAQAEGKASAKKGAVKATVLEADDLDGMLEWLKGELERSIKEMRNE